MISAVAALITALVGVVVFLVSHLGDESGSTAGTTGNASGSAPPGGAVAWQDRLLLAATLLVCLRAVRRIHPVRRPALTEVFR